MTGAVDALGMGSALFDRSEVIVAACARFAELSGRPREQMLGLKLIDLVHAQDRAAGRWLLSRMWQDQASSTFLSRTRRPDGRDFLVESRVIVLSGLMQSLGLIQSRRFSLRKPAVAQDRDVAAAMAGYVVDMTLQMADMATQASMPITCDLLHVAATAGLREGGLSGIEKTPA